MKLHFVISLFFITAATAKVWTKARRRLRGLPSYMDESNLPPDQWFQQKLDHSDPTDPKTWWQRYQYNNTWHQDGEDSPVFLMIGGEGEAYAQWLVSGAMATYARKHRAVSIQLEHRYYGKSLPTVDSSVQNLRYLSSEQALADVAYFIRGMNEKFKFSSKNKWVVFGGSYAGSLAAWARLKYPHLIHGAISSSGPLLAQADFSAYLNAVRSTLNASSTKCADNVHSAALKLNKELHDPKGRYNLSKKFRLCYPVDKTSEKDISMFLEYVVDSFSSIVQYNSGNNAPTSTIQKTQEPTVENLCKVMTNDKITNLIDRVVGVVKLAGDIPDSSFECVDTTYYRNVQRLLSTAFDDSNGGRPWIYQTCTEFGFFQTSSTEDDLFGRAFDLQYFVDLCEDVFEEVFDGVRLQNGIVRSNVEFGALNITVTRVVFVQGSEDPWHVLGLNEANNPESPVIVIEGASHCSNEYSPSLHDPPQLVAARTKIDKLLGEWLA